MNDKKVVVIYKSNTGFTQKYSEWISEALGCTAISLSETNSLNLNQYDIIIFGGGMHAGKINGIKFIKDNLSAFKDKQIVIFATGGTAPIPEEVEKFRKNNVPENENLPFFYFQSGMNYEKMKGADKMLMGILKIMLKMSKNKSDVERGTEEAIKNSYDYSSRQQIDPLLKYVKSL
ncbi:flavodoxin domain-containing protein [Clostridium sp. MSJ-4]|uniref:Flavodoxin domain-containing protein n=1 Tax=Clostridium simiarum TaxID=2841506 RepID=A0ABS6EVR0_9CLOT|nr:flavodoxin domain-containing protein [Clostridium simiarum]MBU5590156.1 flavodoxin domain-containing protein [Clostridium simiarum]